MCVWDAYSSLFTLNLLAKTCQYGGLYLYLVTAVVHSSSNIFFPVRTYWHTEYLASCTSWKTSRVCAFHRSVWFSQQKREREKKKSQSWSIYSSSSSVYLQSPKKKKENERVATFVAASPCVEWVFYYLIRTSFIIYLLHKQTKATSSFCRKLDSVESCCCCCCRTHSQHLLAFLLSVLCCAVIIIRIITNTELLSYAAVDYCLLHGQQLHSLSLTHTHIHTTERHSLWDYSSISIINLYRVRMYAVYRVYIYMYYTMMLYRVHEAFTFLHSCEKSDILLLL